MELHQIIGQIESGMNRRAIRFKPFLYDAITVVAHLGTSLSALRRANQCTVGSAEMISATCWGAFQFTGFRLYSLDYHRPVLEFVESAADQRAMFRRFVAMVGIDFTVAELAVSLPKRQLFALRYNGQAGPDLYAERIAEEIALRTGQAGERQAAAARQVQEQRNEDNRADHNQDHDRDPLDRLGQAELRDDPIHQPDNEQDYQQINQQSDHRHSPGEMSPA